MSVKQTRYLRTVVLLICALAFLHGQSQDNWASWSHTVSTKGYEGQKFRVMADVKTDPSDDSAAARI